MRAVELVPALAALAALVALRGALLRRRGVPGAVALLAEAIPDALGDAVLAIDAAGRIGHANSAAARLLGISVADLVDADLAAVAPELFLLSRGLERGPARARIQVPVQGGAVRVRAALVRVVARPPWALAVLRPLLVARVSPPPLPPPVPPPLAASAPPSSRREARAGLAAAAASLRDPVARATEALSLLRLAAPPLSAQAAGELAAAEDALAVAGRRVAALASAGQGTGARHALDLAALVEELVAAFPAPPGVHLRFDLAPSRALADDRPVRAAVRELLAAAAAALPAGGEIAVAVGTSGGAATIEIRAPAHVSPGGLSLARALVAPQGGRVEEEPVPGRGAIVRIALDGAVALEPA